MKTSKALQLTLLHLWDGPEHPPKQFHNSKSIYACMAAQHAGVDKIVEPILHKLLEDCSTLFIWLCRHTSYDGDSTSIEIQDTRKAWLAYLIQHYKNLGD